MKAKILWALALGLATLAVAVPSAAYRRGRLQVIYRGEVNGAWQVYIFGPDPCHGKLHFSGPANSTKPLEVECVVSK